MADPAGQSLKEPNMGTRTGQFNVTHAFAAHLGKGYFNATFVTDDPPVLHPLVFTAQTFPIRDRSKDASTEQTIPLGLECPIVDGLRLRHLTAGPGPNLLRRSQSYTNGFKVFQKLALFDLISKHSQG